MAFYNRKLTVVEVGVFVVICIVLVLVFLPLLSTGHPAPKFLRSQSNLRQISMVNYTYMLDNGERLLGYGEGGVMVAPTVEERQEILMKMDMGVDLNAFISPYDEGKVAWGKKGEVSSANYSYAMRRLEAESKVKVFSDVKEPAKEVLMSDRNIGEDADYGVQSIEVTSEPGLWLGGVSFMDGHVERLKTHVVNGSDNMFEDGEEERDVMMIYEGQ
ncbi:hypothetical protein JD969_04685 [Planctomycetota bacterium]|nr:hypothetical protein JD969_04685 [Planctomycetota bacterium]